ncbi:helix-turn-helix domain-containing protein [Xanthomonas campestris]|uniref:helix-turn-helix domain-containing protein n=1 Tax=Xanthomonas campestris TaxID=339 RepID=UPI002B23ADDA|nr:helix-turn-helix domain-containing protein [Xanthomonas campestris]MEB1653835.1 helix-turn-helix domain-containing protein [Xanthomonas campestris pv. campestris]MEA9551715.1 helix-turn-helix domain-containing protein [Xanthomonas campestris]MEB1863582.1 helix-turn-helix domain-containing protein [Xanthomonas campestris pv. campestris]MEB1892165.1 helix-turn-helix domain-containing protein [Xanthomonas campestris pv. campestris]MEB2012569.1 helix-turn-helix domain-containing protein [Xantho
MSVEAITWALKQPVDKSSAKFVLVVLANCAGGDNWEAYPSVAYLAEATGQDRKTVLTNMARLVAAGLIRDTGHRRGTTNQVIVYRINPSSAAVHHGDASAPSPSVEHQIKQSQKRDRSSVEHFDSEQARNWDSFEAGTVPFFPGNSPVFPPKQSQKRDTEPSYNHQETATPHTTAVDAAQGVCGTQAGFIAAALNRAAMALNRPDLRITSQHPGLIAAAGEGVTAEHLLELSDVYPDKPAGYLITAARRQRASGANTITSGASANAIHRECASERTLRLSLEAIERERASNAGSDFLDADFHRLDSHV